MAEVARVVARLLERAQDEPRERLPSAPRLLDVLGDARGDLARELRRLLWRQPVGRRRRRHAEVRELCEQVLDGQRVGLLVHAVERLAAPAGEERADELVGEDHQLLHEHVRMRLALEPRLGDTAAAVEAKDDFRRLHLQGAPREALRAQRLRQLVVQVERLEDVRLGIAPLRLPVGQAHVRADHGAVEARLAVRRDLNGDAEPVLMRSQRAEVVGEVVRQHRRDLARHVRREGAARRALVERRSRRHEERDVRDVHPRADAVVLAPKRERVVEVLRGVRIDRVGQQVAQVDPVRDLRFRIGRSVRLERLSRTALDEQRLEHVLDAIGRPEPLLDLRPAAPGTHHSQVAVLDVTDPLRVEHDRHARREVRLTDDEPAAPADLDDETGVVAQTRRKRRIVRPEPIAPSARPMPIRISATRGKASACTSESPDRWGRIDGSASALPITRKSTARTEPASPQKRPSSMNGPRTNQFVAPTSFITSISRRREKIDRRIVFAISKIEAISKTAVASVKTASITCATCRIRCETCLPSRTLSTPGGFLGCVRAAKSWSTFSALFGVTSSVSGNGFEVRFLTSSGYFFFICRSACSFGTYLMPPGFTYWLCCSLRARLSLSTAVA